MRCGMNKLEIGAGLGFALGLFLGIIIEF